MRELAVHPIVTLVPNSVAFSVSNGELGPSRHVFFKARMPRASSIRSKNDKELGNLEWEVQISQAKDLNEYLRENKAVGSATFVPASDSIDYPTDAGFCVYAALENEELDSLISAIRSGSTPKRISLEISGLKYGWEPDGSGKIWDTEEAADLFVSRVTVVTKPPIAFAEEPPFEEDDDLPKPEAMQLATPGDIGSLRGEISSIERGLRLTKNWIILIGAAITAAVLLR